MNEIITIDWVKMPTKRELHSQLNRVNLPADAKVVLMNISDVTYNIQGKIIEIGRRIIAFVLELVRNFPNITIAVIAALVISSLIGSIALLGPLLQIFIGPLIVAGGIAIGTLAEMREGRLGHSVDWLTREVEALIG